VAQPLRRFLNRNGGRNGVIDQELAGFEHSAHFTEVLRRAFRVLIISSSFRLAMAGASLKPIQGATGHKAARRRVAKAASRLRRGCRSTVAKSNTHTGPKLLNLPLCH